MVNWNFVYKVILISEAIRQRFCGFYTNHSHKTEMIFNGVSLSDCRPPKKRNLDLDIGMLSNTKLWNGSMKSS